MRYVSTRARDPQTSVDFGQAVLEGLAPDGGLYLPAAIPRWSAERWRALRGQPFATVAAAVLAPFVQGSLDQATLQRLCASAWSSFDAADVAPLRALPGFAGRGDAETEVWLLELFHGPTLAFKDVALQLLGLLFDELLGRAQRHATILGATSGDTGSAAIAGCRGRSALDIVILHPEGRTSAVQRRQMTTVLDGNVHNVAVRGSFDDCQAIVKQLFGEAETRQRYGLTAVNSINVARVLAQMVYYATAALQLGAPERPVRFCVPTGNFGDVLAGHWARRMGLPIEALVIATNRNDILARTLATGQSAPQPVAPTLSPSMDIVVSSNFERLLYELHGDDADWTRAAMAAGAAGFALRPDALARLREGFAAGSCDDDATMARIAQTWADHAMLVDPHTAVGLDVADAYLQGEGRASSAPLVVLSTAHPAKFPEAVERATGQSPALPPALADLATRQERFVVVDASADAVRAVLAGLLSTP